METPEIKKILKIKHGNLWKTYRKIMIDLTGAMDVYLILVAQAETSNG